MKRLLSALLSCSLLCSNTFAAEKSDANVHATQKTIKTTQNTRTTHSSPKITSKKALGYCLIPASLSTLGFVGLAVVRIACAHSDYKNSRPVPSPTLQPVRTPSPVSSPIPQPVPRPVSSPVPPPIPQPVPRPVSSPVPPPIPQPVPQPWFVPTTRSNLARLPRIWSNSEGVRDTQGAIYNARDNGMDQINNALMYEAATNNAAQSAQRLKGIADQNSVQYSIPDVPDFKSERATLEQIRDALTNADIGIQHKPADKDDYTYLFEVNDQVTNWVAEAGRAETRWKAEETKWQQEVINLRQRLDKVSLPVDLSGSTIVELHKHMPKPKKYKKPYSHDVEDVSADGPHVVLNIQQFRQYVANVPEPKKLNIIFRGAHFEDDQKANEYNHAFMDEGLLISTTMDNKANGGDVYRNTPENRGRKGHSVYLSNDLGEAISYAEMDNYCHPKKRVILAALMPDHPKVTYYGGGTIYTGYPDVNSHFVLCSEFFKYTIPSNNDFLNFGALQYLSDYKFNPRTVTDSSVPDGALDVVRELQIHLLRAGIIIRQSLDWRRRLNAEINIEEADRLLAMLNQPLAPPQAA